MLLVTIKKKLNFVKMVQINGPISWMTLFQSTTYKMTFVCCTVLPFGSYLSGIGCATRVPVLGMTSF